MAIAGGIIGSYAVGVIVLLYLSIDLSNSNQALVLASALSSVGTLALALATFVNVSQNNERLQIQQKKREKPLGVDELSYLIQPAIDSLENNLRQFHESDNPGCAFDWVYIDGADLYTGTRAPNSVRVPDSLPTARLAVADRMLYSTLRTHDNYVELVAEHARSFHERLKPEIQRLLDEEGIDEVDQSLKVVTSAVLKELDRFGESHELYEFWEKYGDDLIRYGREELDPGLDDLQGGESVYKKFMEEAIRNLKQRKAEVKHEYSISEDEISSPVEDIREII